MQGSIFIWNFLSREYLDNHPVIYIYTCGGVRSSVTAISKVMDTSEQIFCPPISKEYLLTVVKGFLEMKKKQYLKGEIKVKPIY
jgi:hypothetical protein